uniref:POTRA domain-containing protein n=1 Tax=Eucheuma denticulatum TaxID=305493 RepID=A0A8E7UFH9_9FLOR|nr:hypothetical protein [Eucheuma denticulatum]
MLYTINNIYFQYLKLKKKIIIFIIILNLQFLHKIYSMLYRLKYLLICISLAIYLIFLGKNINANMDRYTKTAFNTHIIHNKKLKKIHTQTQRIQIRLEGCKHTLFYNIFPKYYQVLQKYRHHHIKIIKLIEYLQNSGFFNKIEYFIVYSNNIIHLIVNFNINPIIKKIEIVRWNQLRIPQTILIHIFKTQIGLPINYQHINNSVKKIYEWYQERGFEYIYIQLIQNKKYNTISLHIFEGKIKSNQFIYDSKCNISHILVHKIEKIIEQKLNILPGSLFNIKILKKNIKYLKNIRLIQNLKYDIIYDIEGLIIKIKYSIPVQSEGHFYHKHFILNSYAHQIQSYTLDRETLKNQYIITLENIKNNFNYTLYYRYLGFKTFFTNLNSKYYNLTVNIVLNTKVPQLNVSFFYPNIEFIHNILNDIKINIRYKIYSIKTLYPSHNIQAKYFGNKNQNKLKNKTLLHLIKTHISCKYLLTNKIDIIKDISHIYNTNTYKSINLNSYFITQNIKFRNKIINTIIQQKLFTLNLQIKYNNLDLKNKFRSGRFIFTKSISFKLTNLSQIKIIYNRSSLKYYQTFTITNLFPYIKKSIILIFSEISLLRSNNIILFDSYYTSSTNIYLALFNIETIKTYTQYVNHIEYHIQIYKFLSSYFFYHLSNKLHYLYRYYYYTQNLGLGIQFNIPINNIPNIRLEYGTNIYQQTYYQLRLFYSYIN